MHAKCMTIEMIVLAISVSSLGETADTKVWETGEIIDRDDVNNNACSLLPGSHFRNNTFIFTVQQIERDVLRRPIEVVPVGPRRKSRRSYDEHPVRNSQTNCQPLEVKITYRAQATATESWSTSITAAVSVANQVGLEASARYSDSSAGLAAPSTWNNNRSQVSYSDSGVGRAAPSNRAKSQSRTLSTTFKASSSTGEKESMTVVIPPCHEHVADPFVYVQDYEVQYHLADYVYTLRDKNAPSNRTADIACGNAEHVVLGNLTLLASGAFVENMGSRAVDDEDCPCDDDDNDDGGDHAEDDEDAPDGHHDDGDGDDTPDDEEVDTPEGEKDSGSNGSLMGVSSFPFRPFPPV